MIFFFAIQSLWCVVVSSAILLSSSSCCVVPSLCLFPSSPLSVCVCVSVLVYSILYFFLAGWLPTSLLPFATFAGYVLRTYPRLPPAYHHPSPNDHLQHRTRTRTILYDAKSSVCTLPPLPLFLFPVLVAPFCTFLCSFLCAHSAHSLIPYPSSSFCALPYPFFPHFLQRPPTDFLPHLFLT